MLKMANQALVLYFDPTFKYNINDIPYSMASINRKIHILHATI